ncbi:Hypothetical predicted protein [Paramuricea clavata]|uniref:Uncharacterized protein n=1 Tax=Paramuricea clavata TaxID=317549 RepID=A0A6S7JD10_PARCT|nr:Hypothetical predicted protein [Paramuricea clavata]
MIVHFVSKRQRPICAIGANDLYSYNTSVNSTVAYTRSVSQSSYRREPQGSQSASEICRSWNAGACSSPRELCRCAVVRESFVDFATVAIERSAAAFAAESTVARRATGHHNARKMPYEATELDRNEQLRKISSCISLNFPDVQTISPINLTNFELQLKSHSDRRRVDYVLNGLRFGFQLGFHSHLCKLKSATSNCISASEHPAVIDEYLNKEVSLGRVFGPTKTPPLKHLHVSRFGVIPKKGNAWRLILDLSFPLHIALMMA